MAFDLLRSIVRRFHCHGTHHRLAWDALSLIKSDSGRRLVRMLRRHHGRYLVGSMDPDTRFCDFQNHVIHAREGFWGGAPRVAHAWYDRMLRYLRTHRYSDATHAAGVLSHYFSDPLNPLHTYHDERERVLHGPVEWSLHCSYDRLLRCWQHSDIRVVFQLSDHDGWLGEAMLHGARYANRKYESLLDGYDPSRALNDPAGAMTPEAWKAMVELCGLAITGWAKVLERIAEESELERGAPLPSFSRVLPAAVASARIPNQNLKKWSEHQAHRIELAELLDEWRMTGDIREHLPTEVDIVHRVVRVRRDEKRWKLERERRLASKDTAVKMQPRRRAA
ncbi:MAG: hypothetical protein AAGI63_01125 [Planctomycetota bacterium]